MDATPPNSPLHQRILDFEARIRRWRFVNAIGVGRNTVHLVTNNSSTNNTNNRNIIINSEKVNIRGSQTSPMPRRIMNLVVDGSDTRRRPPPGWPTTLIPTTYAPNRHSDSAEVQRRYDEIKARSGRLIIQGVEYRATLDDLENICPLGSGSSGHVDKMRFKPTGHIMAVKKMARTTNKDENKRVIMDLDVVLRSHDCPFIVKCLGCFITECDVWVCMELMATCLDKLSKRLNAPIPEAIIGKMAVSIVKALDYLKDAQGIIHRDVKPSNMLLDWNGTIKLCDFGISGRLVDSKARTRTAGCAAYMAPERIDPENPNYDIRADVWSLGISLVELATGRFPYPGCTNEFEILSRILKESAPQLTLADGFSDAFCDFVRQCLTKEHLQRPKYKQLLAHPFIVAYAAAEVDVAYWFSQVMLLNPATTTVTSGGGGVDANRNFDIQ